MSKCDGCGCPPIFLTSFCLPNGEMVRICGTCQRKIERLDAAAIQYGDPRHETLVLREMPPPTRCREVITGHGLILDLTAVDSMGGRGAQILSLTQRYDDNVRREVARDRGRCMSNASKARWAREKASERHADTPGTGRRSE